MNLVLLTVMAFLAVVMFFALTAYWTRNIGKPGTKAFGDERDFKPRWKQPIAHWRLQLQRGASNKALERSTLVTLAMPAAANAGVGPNANDPILVGVMAGVVTNSYTSPTGVVTGNCAIDFEGAYFLSVVAKSSLSPSTGKAINPGDPIYYDGGTLDATTNVKYGGTLDANSSTGVFFGNSLDKLTSGSTGTVRVRLPGAKAA